ncbi:MAG: hypothetical protein Q4D42_03055 [Eubacteriales bacterium]|nr:hypothetical protein [Eubacteriales bacterium]
MAKAISVILNLRDNASKGLIGVANRTKGVSKEMKGATRTVVSWKNSFNKSLDSMTSKVVKWGSATVGAIAGFAAKTGFSEAMDLEGYRMQLETATKDTEKAASIMKYAIDLANKTPFEGGQMVEGAAKFEAMGMSAKKWLTLTGDMAAATNKDFDQATEALIDAQTGELERLKEFGITKAMILEQGEKMFSGVQIANNNGQIVNQEKFNEALVALMEEKYAGGMEKQATTLKGVYSTITGVTKSALAKIAGMNEDGTVRAGSAFDLLRQKASALSEKLQQWQSDGTIDRLSDQSSNFVQQAAEFAENVGGKIIQALDWISQHSEGVKTALTVLGIVFAAFKIVGFIGSIVSAVNTLSAFAEMLGIAGGAITGISLPILGAVAVIAVLIAAGVALYQNWDTICAYAAKLRDWVVEKFNAIRDGITGAFDTVKSKVSGVFSWFSEKFEWISSKISWLRDAASNLPGVGSALSALGIGENASGTPYWRGGLTRINERGGEIVDLPSGTRIIPHDISKKQAGGKSVVVNLTIQGNVIGNREYMEETGEYIARKIIDALDIA